MLKVGLTGSIAVGKTSVCDLLGQLGCHVMDADHISRDVVEPGTKGLRQIVEHFGGEVLQADGSLDRVKMGSIVFADEQKRQLLNSIVHPLVIETQDAWLRDLEREDRDGIAVVDAALMIESGGYKRFSKLIVVWCNSDIQLQRLMLRNNLNEEDARKRIAAQMPQEEKKRYADYLIDTTAGFAATKRQTSEVFEQLNLLRE